MGAEKFMEASKTNFVKYVNMRVLVGFNFASKGHSLNTFCFVFIYLSSGGLTVYQ